MNAQIEAAVREAVQPFEINYTAEPTPALFHQSNAFIRGLLGPVGSSKTSACVVEILHRAMTQKPFRGVRRTRWAVIRNTYPELKSTTIKTFQEWFPENIAKFKFDSPITALMDFKLPDGTYLWCEVLFISCDRAQDIGKLKSLNLTGVFMNEASELSKEVFDQAFARVGRFPSKREGGHSWCGIIMDTNAPDDDHWYYQLAENPDEELLLELRKVLKELSGEDRKVLDFFRQPGAMYYDKHREAWLPNEKAENIGNLTEGMGYYYRQLIGKSENWIKVYIAAQYGVVGTGIPVYSDFNDHLHVAKETIDPLEGVTLMWGQDFGLSPAGVPCQLSPAGRLLVLGELTTPEHGKIGVRQFIHDLMKPYLINRFGARSIPPIIVYGDPAGSAASQANSEAKDCFGEFKAAGFNAQPAKTNIFTTRRDAVTWFLTRMIEGEPAFQLDPSCSMLRKGFNGRYYYDRVQNKGEEGRYHNEPVKNKYCVSPDTKILTADLRWINADEINVGDVLYGFTEEPEGLKAKRWRRIKRSQVMDLCYFDSETVKIKTQFGNIEVSRNHRLLAAPPGRNNLGWMTAEEILPGWRIAFLCQPWAPEKSYEAGWLSGMLDGEGSFSVSRKETGYSSHLSVAQRPGITLDKLRHLLSQRGFKFGENIQNGCASLVLTKHSEIMRALGTFRPQRLLEVFGQKVFTRWSLPAGSVVVDSVEAGNGKVVGIQTATGTLFTNGFASHNSHPHDALQYPAVSIGMAPMVVKPFDTRPKWQRDLMRRKAGSFMSR